MKYASIVVAMLFVLQASMYAASCDGGIVLLGRVLDARTHISVSGVTVSTVGDDACESAFTDDRGAFKLGLSPRIKYGQTIRVRAEKTGYDPFDQIEAVSELPLEVFIMPKQPGKKETSPSATIESDRLWQEIQQLQ